MMNAKTFFLTLLVFTLFSGCMETKPVRPNMILILADDLSYGDLSCYGQERFTTPHLDALAQQGIRFSTAYCGAPECAPSRATLLTGLHTGHSTIRLNTSVRGQDHLLEGDVTIAEVLKEEGYHTAFIGKWGIGLPGTEGVPDKQGFDLSFGFYNQTQAHTYYPFFLYRDGKRVDYPGNEGFDMARIYAMSGQEDPDAELLNVYDENGRLIPPGIADPTKAVYSEALFEAAALDFIREHHTDPFFLYYATQLPHGPVIIDSLGALRYRTDFPLQKQKEWAAMVTRLDQFTGQVVSLLKELKLDEKTLIAFASDNGYSMCGYMGRGNRDSNWPDDPYLQNKGPFSGGKFSTLLGGLRVPFFIYYPGFQQGMTIEESVWLIDLFPTFAELAGSSTSSPTDGKSLVSLLRGTQAETRENRCFYWERFDEQTVIEGDWLAYRVHPDSITRLFNWKEDPLMTCDRHQDFSDLSERMSNQFVLQHQPSEWYHNPGDSRESDLSKKDMARQQGTMQRAERPNGLK